MGNIINGKMTKEEFEKKWIPAISGKVTEFLTDFDSLSVNDAGYKEGVSYGISTCNAEFHALVHDAYEKFDCLKRVGKSDVEKILSELIETSLGDDINPNMEYKKKIK
jgi:hypothetical protein